MNDQEFIENQNNQLSIFNDEKTHNWSKFKQTLITK